MKEPLPEFVTPQLATLVKNAPAGAEWLHEVKLDGYRILCRLENGRARLFSRSGQDWTARFFSVAQAAARLPAKSAWLDGEVAVLLPDGTTSFQALQNHANDDGAGDGGTGDGESPLTYFVFDLLHLDGRDLRAWPLEERKQALAAITRDVKPKPVAARKRAARAAVAHSDGSIIRYSDHLDGDGPRFFAEACRAGLEGIVSKRRDRPYVAGRSGDWVKTKCVKRQELVIGGFTEPQGARQGIGALLVGFHRDGQLRYAGKVGTGYTAKSALALRRRLDGLIRATSPFSPPARPAPRAAHWVSPTLVAEIAFTQITSDGKLRHPSFQGLRDDKPAASVVREVALPLARVRAEAKTRAPEETLPARDRPDAGTRRGPS
jgi:bifunctional non-homologous end joining protein LigD